MEEKIITGKFKKSFIPLLLCVIALVVMLVLASAQANDRRNDRWSYHYDADIIDGFVELLCFSGYFTMFRPIIFYLMILIIVVSLIIYFMTRACELTVSTTRVVGKSSFGKRVDLPLSQISAIGYSLFNGISIATSSGSIKFWLLTNREDVHKALSEEIAKFQVQNRPQCEPTASAGSTSCADELKKFKELLDAGVITQEEFDTKKKQLLGL